MSKSVEKTKKAVNFDALQLIKTEQNQIRQLNELLNRKSLTDNKRLKKYISKTNKCNKPINRFSRIIVETADKPHKALAVITDDNFELSNGIRIRLKPVYDD